MEENGMKKEFDEAIYKNAEILWNYLILKQELQKADCILVFGGHDPSVAIHAANLYKAGWASTIIVSGGVVHPAHYYGLETELIEAEALGNILLKEGVDENSILLERRAKNTSENFWFTRELIEEKNLDFNCFILVQKPYTERRTLLTGQNRWPDKSIIVSSINTTFEDYMGGDIQQKKILDMITGEIYRIAEYPKLGYFKEQIIPEEVKDAYSYLKSCGFDARIR